jgi:tetrapyrrole methylase family protein/MazG family protein
MAFGTLIDRACAALGLDPLVEGLQIVPARALDLGAAPVPSDVAPGGDRVQAWSEQQGLGAYRPTLTPYPLTPSRPALLAALAESDPAGVRAGLLLRYPADHQISLLEETGALHAIALSELAHSSLVARSSALVFVPALPPARDLRSPDGPAWVAQRLLGPGGCPWDVRQTHQSLRAGLLEEAYEVLEALDAGDMDALVEELGDLLLQTLVHAEMARQAGRFELGDVHAALAGKLIGRHPHVFGDLSVAGEAQVLRNWEAIKQRELAAKGRARPSALDGVPPALPALAEAQKLVRKAARVGFNWPSVEDAWAKFREELAEFEAEFEAEGPPERLAEELGDVLYTLATLARWLDIDAETALRAANGKFRRRFTAIERAVASRGSRLADLGFEEILALWAEAKLNADLQ